MDMPFTKQRKCETDPPPGHVSLNLEDPSARQSLTGGAWKNLCGLTSPRAKTYTRWHHSSSPNTQCNPSKKKKKLTPTKSAYVLQYSNQSLVSALVDLEGHNNVPQTGVNNRHL